MTLKPSEVQNLYQTHRLLILNYVRRYANDRSGAEDLLQDTFEQILKYAHTFDPRKGSFPAWACRIARNVAQRQGMRGKSRLDREIADAESRQDVPPVDAVLLEDSLNRMLLTLMAELPEPERTILDAKYFKKQSLAQIALATGMGERTISRRVARAMELIRKGLEKEGLDEWD